jgi:hypothetical protein
MSLNDTMVHRSESRKPEPKMADSHNLMNTCCMVQIKEGPIPLLFRQDEQQSAIAIQGQSGCLDSNQHFSDMTALYLIRCLLFVLSPTKMILSTSSAQGLRLYFSLPLISFGPSST